MMIHRIPAEFESEDKIFGGHFTLKQAVYFVAGLIAAGTFLSLPLPFPVRLFLAGTSVLLAVLLAVIKIYEMPGDRFLIALASYLRRDKTIIFIQEKGSDSYSPSA